MESFEPGEAIASLGSGSVIGWLPRGANGRFTEAWASCVAKSIQEFLTPKYGGSQAIERYIPVWEYMCLHMHTSVKIHMERNTCLHTREVHADILLADGFRLFSHVPLFIYSRAFRFLACITHLGFKMRIRQVCAVPVT